MTSSTVIGLNPRSSGSIALAVVSMLMLGTAVVSVHGFLTAQEGAQKHLIVAVIAVYLFIECRLYLLRSDAFGLLSPPLLASIVHFFLAYLLPTAGTIVDPWIQSRFDVYFRSFHEQIEVALIYAGLAAFCMWRGYYLGLGAAARLRAFLRRRNFIRRQFEPNVPAAVAIQVGYFAVVSYAISLGVFGISSNVETRAANIELLDLLNLGLAAGSLSFLLLMCHLYRRLQEGATAPILRIACVVMVILHIVVGAIGGFKSQLVMPFVMIATAKFLVTHRFPMLAIVSGALALGLAYQVVEPYRDYLARNEVTGRSDTASMFDALQNAYAQRDLGHQSEVLLSTQILQRFDLTAMSAIGIQFVDAAHEEARTKGEELAQTIYLAPLLAFTPRALWPDKPTFSTGGWFNQIVLGNHNETAVGMGPTAWLYLVGGLAGMLVGFLCIGFAQAILFDGIARVGAGGVIVFLAAANSLVTIPTDVGPTFVGVMRILPIALVAQWLLLRPSTPKRR